MKKKEETTIDALMQEMIDNEPLLKRIFLIPAHVKLKWLELILLIMAVIACAIDILTIMGVLVEDALIYQVLRILVPFILWLYIIHNARYRSSNLMLIGQVLEDLRDECDNNK